jgi:hypothetical protein
VQTLVYSVQFAIIYSLLQVISLRDESLASANSVWSELHQLNRAQCGFELDLDTVYLRSIAKLSLTVANASG